MSRFSYGYYKQNFYIDYYMMRFHGDRVSPERKRYVRRMTRGLPGPRTTSLRDNSYTDAASPENWHTVYTADGESWYDFIIIMDDGVTDDQMREMEDALRLTIGCAFDCTGRPFTRWFSWTRTPAGIAIIHAIGLDI